MSRTRRRLPPPNWLRAFEAAARHLSFTAAARELHVTQSAVSQQVRLLEQYLQEPLFLRHPRRLQLTTTGEAYLLSVHEAFERLARSTEELFGHRHSERVALRSDAAFGAYWLAPRLADFQRQCPEVELRLCVALWLSETVWEAVSLEVRYGNGQWPGLHAELLFQDRMLPVCSAALRDGDPPLQRPADLERHRLIHVLGDGDTWQRWHPPSGADRHATGGELQVDSAVLAVEYAAAGGGVALVHAALVQSLLDDGRLVVPFDRDIAAPDGFYLVRPETRAEDRATVKLREWLLAQAR